MVKDMLKDLIKKYRKDIIMLDGLLQWALNPTSMSAEYGIEENYLYIEQNLSIAHELTSMEARNIVETLKKECNEFIKLKKNKYDIGNFQKLIIDEISKPQNIEIFEKFILKRKKKSGKNVIRFLNIYENSQIKNYPCLNVQYNAIFGEELQDNELIHLGILKHLYWISSGSSGKREVIPKFIPFLDSIMNNLKLKKWKPDKPNVKNFLNTLKTSRDLNTINFLKDLFKKNGICTLIYKNTKITPHKGIIGIYTTPDPEFRYAGISFLIQKQIFNVIGEYIAEELKEKTQKVLKILEYEIKHGEQPSNKEIIRLFDINIDEIEEYERLINELPFESFSDNQDIKNNASEAIKQIDEPSLYDLLKTLQFDIETARMVGKYLIDSKMINELSRVPIEITSKTSLKPASESLKYKEIICNNCRTPLSDRENPEFCPYCGSSLS